MKIETFEKTVSTADYIENYVNVEEFLQCCRVCENYGRKWSCPPYDFEPVRDYWQKYGSLYIIGKKMILKEEEKENWENLMRQVKEELTEILCAEEKKHPGSVSLSAGSCSICGEDNCSKKNGDPCRFPEKMRYSIESLGGNVGLTADRLLGVPLQWIEEEKIPDYFVLVGGLLY
ncbi:MAG: DUF2284 domain-containing protein [Emergencia sp.]